MIEILNADQMRALEHTAISSGQVSGDRLMERAGRGVVAALFDRWPEMLPASNHVHVFCGPGNNGGDGFVIARLLLEKGWTVEVFLFGDAAKLPPDARRNHDRWAELGSVSPWPKTPEDCAARPDVTVDAVFGIGLTRPLPPAVAAVLDHEFLSRWPDANAIRRLAVDCPSGLDLDTGHFPMMSSDVAKTLPATRKVDLTVTFHTPKPGHVLADGPAYCGALAVADIGLGNFDTALATFMEPPHPERIRLVAPSFSVQQEPSWPMALIGKANRSGHKFQNGAVIVFAGGVGRGGAGRLAARAALRSGAGVVTLVCPPGALQENAMRLDAVMLRSLAADQPLDRIAEARVNGFCLGPGMGVSEQTKARVLETLARRAGRAKDAWPVVVLDADALTSFASCPQDLFKATHEKTVLTPHEGEFARLFPDLAQTKRGQRSKVDVVREAAKTAGCIILLKGEDTVIAAPCGATSVHAASYDRRSPWLATAGAGDCLAGLIVGLASPDAAGPLFNMVEVAAWLHVEAALTFGPGLIAEDLPDQVPRVFARLLA